MRRRPVYTRSSGRAICYTLDVFLQSFFDKSVRVHVVVLRVDRDPIVHGQLDRVPDVQQEGVCDQKGRGPGQTVRHQVRMRERPVYSGFFWG